MKRFKGFFLFLVIMLLSLGIGSTIYARDRDDDQRFDRYEREEQREEQRNERGFGGPKLGYDGRTSGIGRELGGYIVGSAGDAIGGYIGGFAGGAAGGFAGAYYGGRAGDAWERRTNRYAHDRWNSRGSRGHSWRF